MKRTMKMFAAGVVAAGLGLAASAAEPVKAVKPVAAQTKAISIAKGTVEQPKNDSRLQPRPSQDQPPKSRDIIGGGSKVKNGAEPRDARLPVGSPIDPGEGKRPQPVNRGLGRDHTIPDMRDIGAGWQGLGKQVHLSDLGRDAKLNSLTDPRGGFQMGTGKDLPGRRSPRDLWDTVNPNLHNGDGKNGSSRRGEQSNDDPGNRIVIVPATGDRPFEEAAYHRPDRRDQTDPAIRQAKLAELYELQSKNGYWGGYKTESEKTFLDKAFDKANSAWAWVQRYTASEEKYKDPPRSVQAVVGNRGRPTPDDVDTSHAPKRIRDEKAPPSLNERDINRRRQVSQPGEGRQFERMYVDRKELSEAMVGRRTEGRSTPTPSETDTSTGGDRTQSLTSKFKPQRPDGPGQPGFGKPGPKTPPGSNPDPEGGAGSKGDGSSTDDQDGSRPPRQ
jgi:hypothetical protein